MAQETTFSIEELIHLRAAVVLAGMTVSKADKSSASEIEREVAAISKSAKEAGGQFPANDLVQSVFAGEHGVANPHTVSMLRETVEELEPHDLEMLTLERVSNAIENVNTQLPLAAADEFRRAVLHVCRKVEEAAREGGFLGLGGEQVSENEVGAYSAIEAALYGSPNPERTTTPHTVKENASMNWLNRPIENTTGSE
ncbi:MAG TPA: hypothetical protein PKY60_09445 [Thermoflexales bacterium]|nr:hypothetical protein [Thermoflexales bacterium]